MGAPSYQRRKRQGRLSQEFGERANGGRWDGIQVHSRYITAGPHGPQAKINWAVGVIRRWRRAVQYGVPVKQIRYPAPPNEGRLRVRP